jgi:hypothetical protein
MKQEWIEYTGSDEQIAEIRNSKHGWICEIAEGHTSIVLDENDPLEDIQTIVRYLICQPHPYAKELQQWADTGQPVWVREHHETWADGVLDSSDEVVYKTNSPNWNIPGAEYRLSPFEEEL